MESKICETCGNLFFRPKRYGIKGFAARRFCSKHCVRQKLKPEIIAPYRSTKRNGHRIDVHRAIMEQHLGRKLGRFEFVHHKNHNKQDNRIENLELVSPKIHSIHHNQKYPLTKRCVVCGSTFTPSPTKRGVKKTCSKTCRYRLLSQLFSSAPTSKQGRR